LQYAAFRQRRRFQFSVNHPRSQVSGNVRQKSGRNWPPFNQQLTLSDSIRRFERSHIGHGTPVILLHDGPANANYWGELVPALAPRYRVIVMDSRGHGRSSRDAQPYGYDLMASDVLALIDFLNIDKAALVGWSDGAIIGLDIAIHALRGGRSFLPLPPTPIPAASRTSIRVPFLRLSSPGQKRNMRSSRPRRPNTIRSSLRSPKCGKRSRIGPRTILPGLKCPPGSSTLITMRQSSATTRCLWPTISRAAGLLIEPQVSHFAFLQDPQQFNTDVLHFLVHLKGQ
jgi:alpha/beta hydrolase fold